VARGNYPPAKPQRRDLAFLTVAITPHNNVADFDLFAVSIHFMDPFVAKRLLSF
jgi:hypothetical protein